MSDVLVNLHGEEHRARRALELKVFRRDFFHHYERDLFPATLRKTIAPFLAARKLDVVDFGHRVLLNLTADFAGVDRPEETPQETEHLLRLLRSFALAAVLGTMKFGKEEAHAEIEAAMAEFERTFLSYSVKRRRAALERLAQGAITEDDLPRDVLMVLLKNEDRIELSAEALLREMAFFLMAGAQTSVHSLAHSMHHIFVWMDEHPEDRDRIYNDPLFLQRCVFEGMRLHPSSPVASRRPTCPVRLPTGVEAGPDETVVIDLINANKDPKMFGSDAASFNPHRIAPDAQFPYGLTFGYGMHACIGRNLAAGLPPRADTDPETHHYGTVTLIARALLDAGARPDPNDPAEMDKRSGRPNWGRYPVLLG
jgi:cytochrome P450